MHFKFCLSHVKIENLISNERYFRHIFFFNYDEKPTEGLTMKPTVKA